MQIDRILGNVGVLYVGAYNSSTQYEYLNCVTYNGSSYVCVNQNGVTGVTPGTTNDWQLSAQKGDTGGQGIQGEQGIQGATGNGIQSIEKTSSNALTDTYTILFTDGSSTTFEVENGKGIVSIEKTSSEGNVDTYTITYNDDTTSTFTVTNGEVTNEELQQALAQERVISDGKYARALKTPVTDVESTQIYAENDVVDDLIIKGAPLTQEIREGYNKFYLPQTSFDIIGLNVNIKNSNELTIKGIPTSTYFAKDFIGDDFKTIIENGKTYTILVIPNYRTETTRLAYYIAWYNSDSEVVYRISPTIWLSNGKAITVFTPEFDQEISYFRLTLEGMTKDVEYDFDLKIMMLEGEYAEDNMPEFELYGASPSIDFPSEVQVASEQNITINETNITIPLTNSAIGQYADTIDRENSVQNKVIQELILTGDENFNLHIEPNYLKTPDESIDYYINFFSVLTNSELLCNTFKNKTFDGKYRMYENVEGISSGGGYKRLYIRIKKERLETVDVNGIKKFLKKLYDAGTPVKVYYVAETPTKNSLQEEIQTALSNFKLYKDLNNVAIDSGSMSFIYNKSLSKTIEEMQDEIQSKDTLIQNLTTRVEALEKAQIDNVTEDLGGN